MGGIVRSAQKGDSQAFIKLMEMYKVDMYKVAKGFLQSDYDVADAIQETITTCYEKIKTLNQPRYFKTWLIKILINKCNDILRIKKQSVTMGEDLQISYEDTEKENVEFQQMLQCLSEEYRKVIVLYYVEGYNTREIGEILQISSNTVKTRLRRGRDIILKEINEEKGEKQYDFQF